MSLSLNGFLIISTIGYSKALATKLLSPTPVIIDTGIESNKLLSLKY